MVGRISNCRVEVNVNKRANDAGWRGIKNVLGGKKSINKKHLHTTQRERGVKKLITICSAGGGG